MEKYLYLIMLMRCQMRIGLGMFDLILIVEDYGRLNVKLEWCIIDSYFMKQTYFIVKT